MNNKSTRLDGKFKNKKGIEYRVELLSEHSKELINFYTASGIGNGEILICSVYTKYTSKTGFKKVGSYLRETYGDYSIYSDFVDLRDYANKYKSDKLIKNSPKSIIDDKLGRFVNVIEQSSDDFYHKLIYDDNMISSEIIQRFTVDGLPSESLDLELTAIGKKVRATKLKSIEYVVRSKEETSMQTIMIQSLDYIALKKDIKWMLTRDYRIINEKQDLLDYVERMKSVNGVIGFDTETTGLRINRLPMDHPQRDNLVGICLSVEEKEGVYIPIRHTKFTNLDEDFAIETLRPLLSNEKDPETSEKIPATCDVVTHYGLFDWKVMYTYGWDLNITDDTYLLQYLIDVREANAVKKLKVMSEKILGLQMIDLQDFFPSVRGGAKADIQFSLLPYDSVRHYGPVDAGITRELFYVLRPQLPTDMKFIYGVEVELMKRFSRIEYYGIKLDISSLVEQQHQVHIEKDNLVAQIYQEAGEKFNINSGDQLERIMFDKLHYPSHGTTSSGKRSTGKQVLEILSKDKDKEGNLLYPVAAHVFEYKKKEKLLNSFLDKLVRENVDGFIFPHYNQCGAASGRISCNNPNLQQTTGLIREAFIPDSDDYYFLICDYSQVEYRVMSGLSDEYEVIDFFKNNPEADYHIMMYARMTGKKYEDVTHKERKQGKTLNFGISYGMSAPSLALKLNGSNTKEDVQDAENKIRDYFDSVPNIRDFLTVVRDRARLTGYVKTLFNRRRHINEFVKENPTSNEIEKGRRKAGNTIVQGTAADIMKFAHVRVENAIEKRGLDMRVVASIHDELVMLVNKKYNPWDMIAMVRNAMEIDLSVYNFPPLYIGANVGKSWADGKKDNLEAPVMLMNQRKREVEELGMHKEPMKDPVKQMADELKIFAIEQIKHEIDENNLKTEEEAHGIPRLMKYVGNYLGSEQGAFTIKGLLSGESVMDIFNKLEHIEIYGEDYFDEILDDMDENYFPDLDDLDNCEVGNEDEEEEIIDYAKLQNYYENNKENLLLPETNVRTARETYNEDYSVLGFDKKVIVKINKPTVAMLESLNSYFESVNVPKGYQVYMSIKGKMKATDLHIPRIDRLKIISIIEDHIYSTTKK